MRRVARTVDFVDDRRRTIAATQKICVQGVDGAIIDGCGCRDQGLAQNLPAEHLGAADIAALAAKQVQLQPFERHHLEKVFEQLLHGLQNQCSSTPTSPKRFCMIGLVVVYCRNWRFPGNKCA